MWIPSEDGDGAGTNDDGDGTCSAGFGDPCCSIVLGDGVPINGDGATLLCCKHNANHPGIFHKCFDLQRPHLLCCKHDVRLQTMKQTAVPLWWLREKRKSHGQILAPWH